MLRHYAMGFLLGLCFAITIVHPSPIVFLAALALGGKIAWDLIESADRGGNNS